MIIWWYFGFVSGASLVSHRTCMTDEMITLKNKVSE